MQSRQLCQLLFSSISTILRNRTVRSNEVKGPLFREGVDFRDHGITRIAKVGIIQRQRTPNRLAGARQAPRQLLVPAILCSNLDRRALLATLECLHLPAGHRYSLVWARIRLQAHPFGGHANGT